MEPQTLAYWLIFSLEGGLLLGAAVVLSLVDVASLPAHAQRCPSQNRGRYGTGCRDPGRRRRPAPDNADTPGPDLPGVRKPDTVRADNLDYRFDDRVAVQYDALRGHPPEVSPRIGARSRRPGRRRRHGPGAGGGHGPDCPALDRRRLRVVGVDLSADMLRAWPGASSKLAWCAATSPPALSRQSL
jgi:hypothetical protein